MKNREWYIEQGEDDDWEVRETYQGNQYVLVAYGLTKETALLIAAAPDMRAALKEITLNYSNALKADGASVDQRSIVKARAAITKAEPSTPAA